MGTRWRLVSCLVLSSYGCAALHPQLGDGPCRDAATGRFATCPTEGGGNALLVLGVVAGIGALVGIGYLISRAVSSEPAQPAPPPAPVCSFPIESVLACQSSRTYRFAIPYPGNCPPGSHPLRVVRLTCEARERPAHHACLTSSGGWQSVVSWFTCESFGMTDAPGDFVPPGRANTEGVDPEPSASAASAPTATYSGSSGGSEYVHGYTRSNGTYVHGYTRHR